MEPRDSGPPRLRHWEGSRCWERSGAPPRGTSLVGNRMGRSVAQAQGPGSRGWGADSPPRRAYLSIRSTSARCSAASSVLSACSSLRMGGVS